jgi:hypothetical protein
MLSDWLCFAGCFGSTQAEYDHIYLKGPARFHEFLLLYPQNYRPTESVLNYDIPFGARGTLLLDLKRSFLESPSLIGSTSLWCSVVACYTHGHRRRKYYCRSFCCLFDLEFYYCCYAQFCC